MIKNAIIGYKAQKVDDSQRIVFELFGEDGTRQEFFYDSLIPLADAVEILQTGWFLLKTIEELGFEAAVEECGLQIDTEPTKE